MPTDERAPEHAPGTDGAGAARDPYLAFAARWWWLIILGGLLGVAAAFAYIRYGPLPQESVAQVQVPPQPATTASQSASQNGAVTATTNYTAEATTSQMFTLVSQELAGQPNLSASDLLVMQQEGKIDIRATKGTNFIAITVTDTDPARARLLADTIATVFVRDVNARASAQIDARQQLLEGQIDVTSQRYLTARLNQRLEELGRDLNGQRNLLLQLQTSYQEEVQRQVELDRLAGPTGQPSPEVVATRNRWLETLNGQIAEVERGIRDISGQIDGVRAQLGKLPGSTDPSVSAVFASAYGEQLLALTRDYAQLQLNAATARTPLLRYGVASDPLPATGRKKILLLGGGAGVALAAGLGFAVDWLRRRDFAPLRRRGFDRPRRRRPALEGARGMTPAPVAESGGTNGSAPIVPREVAAPAASILQPFPIAPDSATPEPSAPVVTAPVAAEPAVAEPVAVASAPVEPPAAEVAAGEKSDDLIYLVERARQRRQGAPVYSNGAHENGTGPATRAARHRPLPTHDDEPPLRKAE